MFLIAVSILFCYSKCFLADSTSLSCALVLMVPLDQQTHKSSINECLNIPEKLNYTEKETFDVTASSNQILMDS